MKFWPIPPATGSILFINALAASFLKLFDLILSMLIVGGGNDDIDAYFPASGILLN
jgi:hypothetical protein